MLSADPERAERHDGLLTSGGRSRGGILALCWVTPTPARRQHAAVSHEQSAADLRVSGKTYISALSLCPGYISSRGWFVCLDPALAKACHSQSVLFAVS